MPGKRAMERASHTSCSQQLASYMLLTHNWHAATHEDAENAKTEAIGMQPEGRSWGRQHKHCWHAGPK